MCLFFGPPRVTSFFQRRLFHRFGLAQMPLDLFEASDVAVRYAGATLIDPEKLFGDLVAGEVKRFVQSLSRVRSEGFPLISGGP